MAEISTSAAGTTNQFSVFQDYFPADAPCCLISVSGSDQKDGFAFVEVQIFQQEGHYQPSRWKQVWWALTGQRKTFLDFYHPEVLDRLITSLQEARKTIFTEAK